MSKNFNNVPKTMLETIQQMSSLNDNIAGKQLKMANDFSKAHFTANNTILKIASDITATKKVIDSLNASKINNSSSIQLFEHVKKIQENLKWMSQDTNKNLIPKTFLSGEAGKLLLNVTESITNLNTNISLGLINSNWSTFDKYTISNAIFTSISDLVVDTDENTIEEVTELIEDANDTIVNAFEQVELDKVIEILYSYFEKLSNSMVGSIIKENFKPIMQGVIISLISILMIKKFGLDESKDQTINQTNIVNNYTIEETETETTSFEVNKQYTNFQVKQLRKDKRKSSKAVEIPIASKITIIKIFKTWGEVSVKINGEIKTGFTEMEGLTNINTK